MTQSDNAPLATEPRADVTRPAMGDKPGVLLPPPLIVLAMLAGAAVLQSAWTLHWLSDIPLRWRAPVGALLMLGGVCTVEAGRRALKRHGSNVSPYRPSLAVVTTGVYRRTRNPIYVGCLIALAGIAAITGLDWLPILFVPGVLVLHFGVVRREERYLEQKFGAPYRAYKAVVRRYV